ncbi:MAG: DNA polymerase II large subunit [Methanobacteriota archaeon]|nr:MAG: DNA polymerase II large subunit [Euryarchaeota archaeon]
MIEDYFERMRKELERAYAYAEEARKKGYDPKEEVEIRITRDVASRVEGLLEIEGIADAIRNMEKAGLNREKIAFEITKEIARGELIKGSREELLDKAVRVGTAILTEGVLVAPTEGIAKVSINNYNGKDYVAVYYAGPIRSAGGTVAALTVILADLARRELNIEAFKPDANEIKRVLEEIQLYDKAAARLQYFPPESHIEEVLKNSPVCIDGEPTEEVEVSVNRDHPRIKTNRVRSGVALVICEGLLQKASKVAKYAKMLSLKEWMFIKELTPVKKAEDKGAVYLDGLVIGRPVFSYPSRRGGFRVRYGRTFTTGIMGKNLHPATMVLSGNFLAYGTQLKLEKPGKGAVVASCTDIEGPIVKLKDGSVEKITTYERALEVKDDVVEIIHLGDLLISFGDFLKSNSPLLPPGYVEEIWRAEVKKAGLDIGEPASVEEAFELSKKHNIALHPIALPYWTELKKEQLLELYDYVSGSMEAIKKGKRLLELLGLEHKVVEGVVKLSKESKEILERTLLCASREELAKTIEEKDNILEVLSSISGVEIKDKGGSYVGGRMGRPEKAKLREMEGKPHVLFPTGQPQRSLSKLYNTLKVKKMERLNTVEAMTYYCKKCKKEVPYLLCPLCKSMSVPLEVKKMDLPFVEMYDKCRELIGSQHEIKGVKGLMSRMKMSERLEKGFLRAKHNLYVFRDGTVRFDATDVPLTHFYAKDIGVPIEKLRELGYTKDVYGEELVSGEQIVELYPQDILVSEGMVESLINAAKFIDEMLVKLYGMEPYYNIEDKEGLIGKLVISLSPHTSAGNLARIIGFTQARVGYAHPYLICARRRNADGDEDAIMLLLDGLINFSKEYLYVSRGGTMDSPLILNAKINPKEVDDEVHVMEIVSEYPYELYEKAWKGEMAYNVKMELVESLLDKENPYQGIGFTHKGAYLQLGPLQSTYTRLKSIPEKIEAEVDVMRKIRAVDLQDGMEKVILSHFIPDIYGNLRKFSRQKFRCTHCNEKYDRPPLRGKCLKCNGELTLTIHKGGIEKYLGRAIELADRFSLPNYLKQRLKLVEEEIASVFEDERVQQKGLVDFFS